MVPWWEDGTQDNNQIPDSPSEWSLGQSLTSHRPLDRSLPAWPVWSSPRCRERRGVRCGTWRSGLRPHYLLQGRFCEYPCIKGGETNARKGTTSTSPSG